MPPPNSYVFSIKEWTLLGFKKIDFLHLVELLFLNMFFVLKQKMLGYHNIQDKLDKIKSINKPKKRKTLVCKKKESIRDKKFQEIKTNIENRDKDAENAVREA